MTKKRILLPIAAACALCQSGRADVVIVHPSMQVALGIHDEGHLNVFHPGINPRGDYVGLTAIGVGDGTSPGCLCEGFGVSASGVSGYANVSTDGGAHNLTVDSAVAAGPILILGTQGTSFTSQTHLTSLPGLKITQAYAPSSSPDLFQDTVTIKNETGGDLTDVRYVRVMDWDIPPTEFSEFVTIQGTATTSELELSHDNGFATANPLAATFGSGVNSDFVDSGPTDHGAYFKFNFGTLHDGESKTFSIFYGSSDNEAAALVALGTVGAELYSLGQNNHPTHNAEETFIFGFKGVGGVIIVPPPPGVPDAGSTAALLGSGLLGLAALRRKIS